MTKVQLVFFFLVSYIELLTVIMTKVQLVFFFLAATGASALSGCDCLSLVLLDHQSRLSHVHSGEEKPLCFLFFTYVFGRLAKANQQLNQKCWYQQFYLGEQTIHSPLLLPPTPHPFPPPHHVCTHTSLTFNQACCPTSHKPTVLYCPLNPAVKYLSGLHCPSSLSCDSCEGVPLWPPLPQFTQLWQLWRSTSLASIAPVHSAVTAVKEYLSGLHCPSSLSCDSCEEVPLWPPLPQFTQLWQLLRSTSPGAIAPVPSAVKEYLSSLHCPSSLSCEGVPL